MQLDTDPLPDSTLIPEGKAGEDPYIVCDRLQTCRTIREVRTRGRPVGAGIYNNRNAERPGDSNSM